MTRSKRVGFTLIGSIVIIDLLTALGVYHYLTVEREIKIYEEYELYSERETAGIGWHIIRSNKVREIHIDYFRINIPQVDFDKYYLLWSDGRKIKRLSYKIITKFKWWYNVPKGEVEFDKRHYPHTAFVYKINRVFLKQDLD